MHSFILGVFLLSCGMVFADSDSEVHMNLTVTSQLTRTSETIDINYRRKFVKISTPRHEQVQSTELLHDYNQGHNVMKKNGQCFILHDFDAVPENIKGWESIQADVERSLETGDNVRLYSYKVLPYSIDRSSLPATVQEFCPGPIRVLILDTVLGGEEAQEMDQARVEMGDNPEPRGDLSDDEEDEGEEVYSEIFIPARAILPSRVKRGWWSNAWSWGRRHVTVGRSNGAWRVGIRYQW